MSNGSRLLSTVTQSASRVNRTNSNAIEAKLVNLTVPLDAFQHRRVSRGGLSSPGDELPLGSSGSFLKAMSTSKLTVLSVLRISRPFSGFDQV